MYKKRPCHFHLIHSSLENYISVGWNFLPTSENCISLSLSRAIWILFNCILEGRLALSLEFLFLALWWNILGREGFYLLSIGIGKEFSAYCCYLFLFHGYSCLNPWRSIRAYTLHQDLSIFIEQVIAKVVRKSKKAYTLLDLPC